jgi:hypothetical protein
MYMNWTVAGKPSDRSPMGVDSRKRAGEEFLKAAEPQQLHAKDISSWQD